MEKDIKSAEYIKNVAGSGILKSQMTPNSFKVLFQNNEEFKIPSKLEKS